nr:hypothetical protein Iba_chr11aCG4480 [Ipomoea batatas]
MCGKPTISQNQTCVKVQGYFRICTERNQELKEIENDDDDGSFTWQHSCSSGPCTRTFSPYQISNYIITQLHKIHYFFLPHTSTSPSMNMTTRRSSLTAVNCSWRLRGT